MLLNVLGHAAYAYTGGKTFDPQLLQQCSYMAHKMIIQYGYYKHAILLTTDFLF